MQKKKMNEDKEIPKEMTIKDKMDIVFDEYVQKRKDKEDLDYKKARKRFKPPGRIRTGAKRKVKQNKILLLKLSTIGNLTPEWVKIQDNMVWNKDAGIYHVAENKYIMNFMGKWPCMIVPEWTLKPYAPKDEQMNLSEQAKELTFMQKFIIKVGEMEVRDMKKKGTPGGRNMIIILVAVVAIVYLILRALGLQ